MSTDIDPLDELFSEQVAKRSRAGGKFAPKVKPRPRKETSIKLPSSQSVPNIRSADSETKNPSENNLDSVSEAHSLSNSSLANTSSEYLPGETLLDNVGLQTDNVLDIVGKPVGEEASMDTDVDPLDEIFSAHVAKNARAAGKFPPKTKPCQRMETPIKLAASQSVQSTSNADNEGSNPAEDNSDSVPSLHSFNNSATVNSNSSEQYLNEEALVNNLGLQTDDVLPDINAGEEVSMNNLDPLDEIFTEHVAKGVRADSKFLPKPKIRPIKGSSIKQPSSQPRVTCSEITKVSENKLDDNLFLHVDIVVPDIDEKPAQENADTIVGLETFNDSSFQATRAGAGVASGSPGKFDSRVQSGGSPIPVLSTVEGSANAVSIAPSFRAYPEDHINLDTFPQDESVISHSDGGFHFDDGMLEVEEVETGTCPEGLESIFDMTTHSGQRSLKLQPKPKFQADTKKNGTSISHPDGSNVAPCSDYVDLRPEVLPNEGLTGVVETSFPDASYSGDQPVGLSESLEKSPELRERNSTVVFDDSLEDQGVSISGQGDEASISTRKLRKRINTYSLVDEDGVPDVEDLINDPSSPIEDEDCNDGENEVEKETQKEKKPKVSRKSSSQKEKPVRKRKKGNEIEDQGIQKPHKKFSHSTRRNKRQVDKVLLETPEDEIDMRKLRIRDIILLAEHRERIVSKEGKSTDTQQANQSAGTSFADLDDNYFEDENFASEGGQFGNDHTTSASYFNYHSYMKKTPRSRWSKQETELFYEGVRQFGSDISMIQQLFPDRTRAQIKLKYKKEERQQPLRLREALTNRSADHSHFQRVIEHLKQLAEVENQNSFDDDSIDLTGNREEVNLGTNEEVDNLEEVEKSEDAGMEPDVSESQNPPNSCDSEDDLSTWCQYKSEL